MLRRLLPTILIALAPDSLALELCRDYACSPVSEPGIVIEIEPQCCYVLANGVRTPARSVTFDLKLGRVEAYEDIILRAGFE